MLRRRQSKQRFFRLRWAARSVFFVACLAVLSLAWTASVSSTALPITRSTPQSPTPAQIDRFLPIPQVHALPTTLAQWRGVGQINGQQNDYFDQVQPTIAGYLVWSQFPVRVYLEPAAAEIPNRSQEWVSAVTAAIQDWNAYLPLAIVNAPDTADIQIWRRTPPLQVDRSAGATRQPELRARSAETRFTLMVDRSALQRDAQRQADRTVPGTPILSHRMTIWLGMGQTQDYLRAAVRHELGHALGIWGHSPTATDVMYFAQVRQSPPISDRDINTLKRIYQQPTRLGWAIPRSQD